MHANISDVHVNIPGKPVEVSRRPTFSLIERASFSGKHVNILDVHVEIPEPATFGLDVFVSISHARVSFSHQRANQFGEHDTNIGVHVTWIGAHGNIVADVHGRARLGRAERQPYPLFQTVHPRCALRMRLTTLRTIEAIRENAVPRGEGR
jgi:hypothetical protein